MDNYNRVFFDISIPSTDPNCSFLVVMKWEVAKDSGKLFLPNFMTLILTDQMGKLQLAQRLLISC